MNSFKSDFLNWIKEQPIEEGFRNDTLVRIVREGLGQGFSEEFLKECIEAYCEESDLPLSEAMYILENHSRQHRVNPYESNLVDSSKMGTNWVDITNDFIKLFFYQAGVTTLIFWNGDFYNYCGTHYKKYSEEEVKSKITQYVMYRATYLQKKKMSQVLSEVLEVLKGKLFLPYVVDMPFYHEGMTSEGVKGRKGIKKKNIISFRNGLLELKNNGEVVLVPHDYCYFSTNFLPYDYKPLATCPRWIKFLEETFQHKEEQDLIQEWFAYNLLDHCGFQKFLLCVGSGANGKSVLLKVLSLMLGEGNYCSVGLENFDPKRTFSLASLQGKMANIVNDMNEIKKTGEGLLKQFVAGETITVERKYRDPFSMKPRAKLTLATNVLPRLTDRSDGIWRRMILLRFKNSIKDESKQDKRLMSDEWWISSGELPGVFNWALEGLKRLVARGNFVIPDAIAEDVTRFRNSSNSALLFLRSSVVEVEFEENKGVLSTKLYDDYKLFCEYNGYKPLNSQNFAREIKLTFPQAIASNLTYLVELPNSKGKQAKKVTRVWQGLAYLEGYSPSLGVDHNITL